MTPNSNPKTVIKGGTLIDLLVKNEINKDITSEIKNKDITFDEHLDMERRRVSKEYFCGKRKAIYTYERNCTSVRYATLKEYRQY